MHIYYFSVLLSRGLTWVSPGYQEGINWQDCVPPGDPTGESFSFSLQLPEAACTPWLTAPSSNGIISASPSIHTSPLQPSCFPLTSMLLIRGTQPGNP